MIKRYIVERTNKVEMTGRTVRKQRVVGRIYGRKYS